MLLRLLFNTFHCVLSLGALTLTSGSSARSVCVPQATGLFSLLETDPRHGSDFLFAFPEEGHRIMCLPTPCKRLHPLYMPF